MNHTGLVALGSAVWITSLLNWAGRLVAVQRVQREREIPAHKVPKDSQGCLELGRQRPVPMTNPPDTDNENW